MIYLDNNATTQIHPTVLDVINNTLKKYWGNPSSKHAFSEKGNLTIKNARNAVAELINTDSAEIIFTSCATESNNMAFHSALNSNLEKKHIITSHVEHSSILEICKNLETKGYQITYLSVNEDGVINIDEFRNAFTAQTILVSLMWANNETGVISPVQDIAQLCKEKNVLFHCDAVQAVGKIPVDLSGRSIDYLSISAHKFHGPKGIGALYIKSESPASPLIIGGGQEHKLRGGTYNTAYIAGFGKAAELANINIKTYQNELKGLQIWFENELIKNVPKVYFNGKSVDRIPNTSNFGIPGIDSEIILNILSSQEIYLSTGSACSSNAITPSHVVTAMKGHDKANEAIRVSSSTNTSKKELAITVKALVDIAGSI